MRILILAILILALGGAYVYYSTRPGPAEQAGAALDEAVEKTRRIIDVVTE